MAQAKRWMPLEKDKWGDRAERYCPTCGRKAFQIIREKERRKEKRPGKRADRIVAICANPKCDEHKKAKELPEDSRYRPRVGWRTRRTRKR